MPGTPPRSAPAVGALLSGRYALLARLAERPGHVEYRALDREVDVEVALWWLRPELFGDPARRDAALGLGVELRGLAHPALRQCYGVGSDGEGAWAVWQPVTGPALSPPAGTLAASTAAPPLDELVWSLDGLARGLAALHAAGMVHGRLHPSDLVFVGTSLKLGGGGLWRDVAPAAAPGLWRAHGAEHYLAPEVRRQQPPSEASDAWSLAAVVLEQLAGAPGASPEHTRLAARRYPELTAVLVGAMKDDPGQRPALGELRDALLHAAQAGGRRRDRRADTELTDDDDDRATLIDQGRPGPAPGPALPRAAAPPQTTLAGFAGQRGPAPAPVAAAAAAAAAAGGAQRPRRITSEAAVGVTLPPTGTRGRPATQPPPVPRGKPVTAPPPAPLGVAATLPPPVPRGKPVTQPPPAPLGVAATLPGPTSRGRPATAPPPAPLGVAATLPGPAGSAGSRLPLAAGPPSVHAASVGPGAGLPAPVEAAIAGAVERARTAPPGQYVVAAVSMKPVAAGAVPAATAVPGASGAAGAAQPPRGPASAAPTMLAGTGSAYAAPPHAPVAHAPVAPAPVAPHAPVAPAPVAPHAPVAPRAPVAPHAVAPLPMAPRLPPPVAPPPVGPPSTGAGPGSVGAGMTPAVAKPRIRSLEEVRGGRTYSVAPGQLGYLAPPAAAASPASTSRGRYWLVVGVLAVLAVIAGVVVGLTL